MKYLNKIKIVLGLILFGSLIYTCSVNDDYKEYLEGGEISYTGQIDSLKIFPGRNRVQVEGLIISDPKVTEVRVFWNTGTNFVSIPIDRTDGIDEVSEIIDNLPENVYTFEVRTYDIEGNTSVPQFVNANVYGDRYQQSLYNRPILSNFIEGSTLTINFGSMDLTSGVFGTELEYMSTSGSINSVFIDIADTSVTISDFENGTTYDYRTLFLPEETAIDTFYTDFENVFPIPTPVLGNATQPFVAEAVEPAGRWGTLAAPWITNNAAKSHNGYGGWDNGCCAGREQSFNLECGWGQPYFVNAKVHQTVLAEAGVLYTLQVNIISSNYSVNDTQGGYIVVAMGDGLPNVQDIATAPEVLASQKIDADWTSAVINLPFILEETGQISIGMVATQAGDKYCNISSWEILVN